MAGGNSWFQYKTDGNAIFAINMDTSNGESVANAKLTSALIPVLSRSAIRPRYANYASADGRYKRRIVICDPVDVATIPVAIFALVEGQTPDLILGSIIGERRRIAKVGNTGL